MYLLDANVFINASRLYYSSDIAPSFWEWLKIRHHHGTIASTEAVRQEIDDGDTKTGTGHLKTWASSLPASFWLKHTAATMPSMTKLSVWATHKDRKYTQAAIHQFLRVADYSLVSLAHESNHCVVTFELPAPNSRRRILIPDACDAMSVRYENPFEVYRNLGLRFR